MSTAGRARLFPGIPTALLLTVCACDAALARGAGNTAVVGALDESAHLATTGLVLLAARHRDWLWEHRWEMAVVLSASVLIDLDHVPLYAGVDGIAPSGGRPYSHSLLTVTLLAALSPWLPAGRRRWPIAAAAGVVLHFVRDAVTGPGLPLWWPVSDRALVLPQEPYWVLLLALAAAATCRLARVPRHRPAGAARRAPTRR